MGLQLSPSRLSNIIAGIAIVGILGAFVLVIQASNEEIQAYGPTAITASPQGDILFVAADRLYRTDSQGNLLDSRTLASLGVEGVIVQISMPERDRLLIQSGDNDLQRCRLSDWQCSPLFANSLPPASDLIAWAAVPETQRFYLATLPKHQLYAIDLDGGKPYRLEIPEGLKYANDVVWLGENRLLIADTNHHRIIEIEDLGEGEVRLVRRIEAKGDLSRKGRTWPTNLAQDEAGGFWAINSTGMLSHGDLIHYDEQGRATHRVELGDAGDPDELAPVAGGVLVTDSAQHRLLLVDAGDFTVQPFGDDAVREALQEIASRETYWHRIYYLGAGLILITMALGAWAGYLDWQTRRRLRPTDVKDRQGSSPDAAFAVPDSIRIKYPPDADGIFWLKVEKSAHRKLQLTGLLGVFLLTLMQALILIPFDEALPNELLLSTLPLTLIVVAVFLFMAFAVRSIRLGTDGKCFYLVDIFGRRASAPIEACEVTGQRIVVGKVGVPLKHPLFMFYDKALFAQLIEPLLPHTRQTNELAILWRYLRRGDPAIWGGMLFVVALTFLLLAYT